MSGSGSCLSLLSALRKGRNSSAAARIVQGGSLIEMPSFSSAAPTFSTTSETKKQIITVELISDTM